MKIRLAGAGWWPLATVAVKGFVIPGLLRRAMRAANIDREIEPFIGFVPSLLLGAAARSRRWRWRGLPLLPEHAGTLLVPGALASVLTGFMLLIGRTKAISQVCGYLILENGIYLFGLLLIHSTPLLVEAGILLDLTVACSSSASSWTASNARSTRSTPANSPCSANERTLLIVVPLAGSGPAALWPSDRTRPWLLPVGRLGACVLAFWLLFKSAGGRAGRVARF
jgi:hypothetical protein